MHKPSLIAKTVSTILSLAVEVRLVLPVPAMLVLAVLIKPEPKVPVRNRFVLQNPHRVLYPRFLLIGRKLMGAQGALIEVRRHNGQGRGHVIGGVRALGGQKGTLHEPRVLEHELGGNAGILVEALGEERVLLGHDCELSREVRREVGEMVEGVEGWRGVVLGAVLGLLLMRWWLWRVL